MMGLVVPTSLVYLSYYTRVLDVLTMLTVVWVYQFPGKVTWGECCKGRFVENAKEGRVDV
jgi:hypothetical protein